MKAIDKWRGMFLVCLFGMIPLALGAEADELERAFQKEFAFLENQKRGLEARLAELNASAREQESLLKAQIERLMQQRLVEEAKAERLNQRVSQIENQLQSAEGNAESLRAVLDQAGSRLSDHMVDAGVTDSMPANDKLARIYSAGIELLQRQSSIYRTQSEFFLANGRKVSGTVIHLGQVAAYGVSDEGAGALAPAGNGKLKLWPESTADIAKALLAGEMPSSLKIYLFESLKKGVKEQQGRKLLGVIESGGPIGWVIVVLGALAALMIVLRIIFLRRAGRNASHIVQVVSEHVKRGEVAQALAACEGLKGATARVVASTLRNLDRDRDHIEDIISESLLHEHVYLNRYGAAIIVIAAVSPLMGLLGTVTGMITTFDVITQFGTGDPKLLSGGISTALVTTQLGLIVAIPTLVIGNLLTAWSNCIKDEMEKAALAVVNLHESRRPKVVMQDAA